MELNDRFVSTLARLFNYLKDRMKLDCERLSDKDDMHDLLSIMYGLIAGAFGPVVQLRNESAGRVYTALYTLMPQYGFDGYIGDLHITLPSDWTDHHDVNRVAWFSYVLVRFGLRARFSSVLSLRLRKVADHHSIAGLDAESMTLIIETLEPFLQTLDISTRCLWWFRFCNEIACKRNSLAQCVYNKLTLLASTQNLHALSKFRASGGHEGCLSQTEFAHLEPVLFHTPLGYNGLYVATLHMLADQIRDGSIFSDATGDDVRSLNL